jgi:hypothetical protein
VKPPTSKPAPSRAGEELSGVKTGLPHALFPELDNVEVEKYRADYRFFRVGHAEGAKGEASGVQFEIPLAIASPHHSPLELDPSPLRHHNTERDDKFGENPSAQTPRPSTADVDMQEATVMPKKMPASPNADNDELDILKRQTPLFKKKNQVLKNENDKATLAYRLAYRKYRKGFAHGAQDFHKIIDKMSKHLKLTHLSENAREGKTPKYRLDPKVFRKRDADVDPPGALPYPFTSPKLTSTEAPRCA